MKKTTYVLIKHGQYSIVVPILFRRHEWAITRLVRRDYSLAPNVFALIHIPTQITVKTAEHRSVLKRLMAALPATVELPKIEGDFRVLRIEEFSAWYRACSSILEDAVIRAS